MSAKDFFDDVFIIWKREIKRFKRERSQIFGTIFLSLIWLIIFGTGIGEMGVSRFPGDYKQFLFPGVVGLIILVISLRAGVSVIRDREFGFLRVLLATRANKLAILSGKILGGATASVFNGLLVFALAFIVNVHPSLLQVFYSFFIMLLLATGIVALGITIASFLESFEGFSIVMSTLFMPMLFLSSALFPVEILPAWMQVLAKLNPVTYGVDAIREIVLDIAVFGIPRDISFLILFDAVIIFIAGKFFGLGKR